MSTSCLLSLCSKEGPGAAAKQVQGCTGAAAACAEIKSGACTSTPIAAALVPPAGSAPAWRCLHTDCRGSSCWLLVLAPPLSMKAALRLPSGGRRAQGAGYGDHWVLLSHLQGLHQHGAACTPQRSGQPPGQTVSRGPGCWRQQEQQHGVLRGGLPSQAAGLQGQKEVERHQLCEPSAGAAAAGCWSLLETGPPILVKAVLRLHIWRRHAQAAGAARLRSGGNHMCTLHRQPGGCMQVPQKGCCCNRPHAVFGQLSECTHCMRTSNHRCLTRSRCISLQLQVRRHLGGAQGGCCLSCLAGCRCVFMHRLAACREEVGIHEDGTAGGGRLLEGRPCTG